MKSAAWFAERFGLAGSARLDGPLDRGYQGQIWRLTCGSHTYAVKETFAPLDHDQVLLAYEFQRRAERLGVHAPRQLCTRDGQPAAYAEGETLRLFDWVDLAGPDRGLDPVTVGRTLAALHLSGDVTNWSGDVDPWYVEPIGRHRWTELIAELRVVGAPFADDLAGLLPELVESESITEPPREVITCHRDLWADNVRRGPTGATVVIDWDNCGPASAPGELAMVLVEFGTTAARARRLYDAYLRAQGPARILGVGDFTMPIVVLHHLVELGARQWLAAAGEVARRRAAERVREFTDDPFGLDQARVLLAAASRRSRHT